MTLFMDQALVILVNFRNVPGFTVSTLGKGFIWTKNGGLLWIDDLIDPTLGYQISGVSTIADDGSILAFGLIAGGIPGDYQAFLLRPIPEPSTCTLLLGSVLLLRRRRKL
jgi:hypothetical protein